MVAFYESCCSGNFSVDQSLINSGSKCWYSRIYFSFNKIIQKFTEFIDYCRALEYEETPDYEHLRNMLRNRMKLKNYEFDKNFDWIENDPFQKVQGWQMYKNGDSVNNGGIMVTNDFTSIIILDYL